MRSGRRGLWPLQVLPPLGLHVHAFTMTDVDVDEDVEVEVEVGVAANPISSSRLETLCCAAIRCEAGESRQAVAVAAAADAATAPSEEVASLHGKPAVMLPCACPACTRL